MSEKIYIRKCESYTLWEASEPIEVDVEKLRKCEPPYEGETNEDLLNYISENVWNNDDWYDNETNVEVYGEDEAYRLSMEESDMKCYSDSRNKGCENWLDIGVPNEEYRKMGSFEVKETNG
jgi:hypothetical protein|tara:strand:+ start:2473 stop:2835 length:363 start_codon:yes stop_codon:yes gene_type:complete